MKLIARSLHGFESVLAEELKTLGAKNIELGRRAVFFTGNQELLYRANIRLHTAIRILKPILQVDIFNYRDLYDVVYNIPWEDYFHNYKSFAIKSAGRSNFFKHSKFFALKAKDAIVDRFRMKTGKRPNVDISSPNVRIDLFINERKLTISLDSSGDSLHLRSYKTEHTQAPLNEVLAASLLRISNWNGDTPLYVPMCGSGTWLTEAWFIANGISPQIKRKVFSFMHWNDFDAALYKKLKNAKPIIVKTSAELKILGSDVSSLALEASKANLKNLGLETKIDLLQHDFFTAPAPIQNCQIMLNPPYDQRMAVQNAKDFYKTIGDILKQNYQGSVAWIISGNKEAIKHVGLRPSKKITIFNGPIESKFHKFELY